MKFFEWFFVVELASTTLNLDEAIIKCICIKNNEIAFNHKAKEELLNMFQTWRRLFRIIYHHKTTCKIEHLIQVAIQEAEILPATLLEHWQRWDDYELICELCRKCPKIFDLLAKRDFSQVPEIISPPDKDVEGYLSSIVFV